VLMILAAAPRPRSSGAHGLDESPFLDVNRFARGTGWLHAPMRGYAVDGGIVGFAVLLLAANSGWPAAAARA
jgi:hypothetical protein